jgi:replicative DNA helicase
MSKEIKDKAKEYLKAQLSVIPTKEDKLPALPTWKPYQSQRIKEEEVESFFTGANVKGLAIICGAISGGLEVIDVDTKHDTTGSLWDELRGLIEDNLPELYSRLVIAQTKSGGYHIYYRCSSIAGNLKLSTKKNKDVLIETRGEGGYVIAPPTTGYTYTQGEPGNITTITPEERDILFSISKSFNELEEIKPKVNTTTSNTYSSTRLSPFEDYNQRGDVVGLLESKGWIKVNQQGQRINLLRPGSTDSKTSGNYHTGLKVLRVFSSSTEFNPDKGYSPSQVFSLLECNGDNKLTYRRLLELGYGEPYKGEEIRPTQVKTERIKVEVVNLVNRVSSVISTPGESLKIENIQTAIGEEVVITSPGPEAQEEILKAIDLILQTGKRIYIKEGATEIREYSYQLRAIFNKYGTIQDESGGLTHRDRDSLLDEVVIVSTKLQPIDKDVFLKEFIELEPVKELGITEESLSITVDRLTSTRDKEAQAKEFKKLLSEATQLQDKGETDKALELLDSKVKEVKIIGAKDLLPPPITFTTLLDEIATLPPAYKTGYSSLDSFVGFTPGAISLIAGRPSHGKTTFMFNLLLEMSRLYQDKSFYFFTYEEPLKNISIKLLNRLIATDLSGYFREVRDLSTPTNYEFIKSYIKARRTDIIQIEEGKRQLQELIDSQRIKVIDRNYSVEELSSLIAYLNKREKIGGVFIDYIQRMKTDAKTQDMRTKIAHISDSVLQIAKESGLPIILGAQLNRATQDSKGGKPKLENLKEAGNLEEDANTVLSVYNESREKDETSEGDSYKGLREVELEIKALKNREGEVNQTALLTFDKWTGVIKNSSSSGSSYFK